MQERSVLSIGIGLAGSMALLPVSAATLPTLLPAVRAFDRTPVGAAICAQLRAVQARICCMALAPLWRAASTF